MSVFEIQGTVLLVVNVLLLAIKIYAFVSSLMFSAEAYEAAGKLTKTTWNILLGLGVLLSLISVGLFILSLIFTVAAFVYLADVKPALQGLRRR